MKKLRFCALFVCLATFVMAAPKDDDQENDRAVLEFKTMAAVIGPFVGSANPIRGISGGGLPWMIREAEGSLTADGRLTVQVRGLVLANMAPVPVALRMTNPVPNFRAIVSCRTIDGMRMPAIANISTEPFPATATGDANIDAKLDLPKVCYAPIVFVTSPTGAWFAATGFMKME